MKRVSSATCRKIAVHMCRLRGQEAYETLVTKYAKQIQDHMDIQVAIDDHCKQGGRIEEVKVVAPVLYEAG